MWFWRKRKAKEKEPELCINCSYCIEPGRFAKCTAPENIIIDVVNGGIGLRSEYCSTQRNCHFEVCGPEGKWFKPKEGYQMECAHKWEVVTDKVLSSAREQCHPNAVNVDGFKTEELSMFFRKTSITILKCIHCGKLDKTIVRSTDCEESR
jgi:hypothetical protein